jgi:hypothetical protein
MQTVIINKPPFPASDLHEIERRLSACDGIIHFDPKFQSCSFSTYQITSINSDYKYRAVFDLNILSAVLSIAKGHHANGSMKDAAALMAFLISLDCMIEPGICAQEYSTLNGEAQTVENIRLFRQADNIHPSVYAEIACDRRHHLTPDHVHCKNEKPFAEFKTRTLSPYLQIYAALLKLAIIMKSGTNPLEKLRLFTRWQRDEYFHGACATIFAIQALGTQPIKDPFKQRRIKPGADPLAGVRNAAWDLAIVKFWGEKILDDFDHKIIWLLCSFDKSLKQLARHIIATDSQEPEQRLLSIVKKHWSPSSTIDSVLRELKASESINSDQARIQRVNEAKMNIHHTIRLLEQEFTSLTTGYRKDGESV